MITERDPWETSVGKERDTMSDLVAQWAGESTEQRKTACRK